jgi:hypothetical protein
MPSSENTNASTTPEVELTRAADGSALDLVIYLPLLASPGDAEFDVHARQ